MEDWEEGAAETLERLTGSPMADAVQGTIRIVSLSEPKGRLRYQACEMDLILEGAGLDSEPLTTEVTSTAAIGRRPAWCCEPASRAGRRA